MDWHVRGELAGALNAILLAAVAKPSITSRATSFPAIEQVYLDIYSREMRALKRKRLRLKFYLPRANGAGRVKLAGPKKNGLANSLYLRLLHAASRD